MRRENERERVSQESKAKIATDGKEKQTDDSCCDSKQGMGNERERWEAGEGMGGGKRES